MTSAIVQKQVNGYLPLLSSKQQILVLEMIKTLLNVESGEKRITKKQYNKEINDAVLRMDSGNSVTHQDAINELSSINLTKFVF
ncbi:MAG: hypothetical protein EBS08_04090 [Cytophagia bacterium]|jgi:hypothetical protein|nr:hypothetical protein [Cytophagia bacterium]